MYVMQQPAFILRVSSLFGKSVRRSSSSGSFFRSKFQVKTKMRRSMAQAAIAAARRRLPISTTAEAAGCGSQDIVSHLVSGATPSSSREEVVPVSRRYHHTSCHSHAADASAPAAAVSGFPADRRRNLSTAAAASAACHDDCGKPCPEDCEGHSMNPNPASAGHSGPTNYFQVLGLTDQTYQIDPATLKSTYKRLMAQYHPDRYHSLNDPSSPSTSDSAPKSMDELHELSSSITRAYDVLSDPHSRAEHLLELHGAAITENCSDLVDMGLLMEVMTIREEIDEASDDAQILRTLLGQNEERIQRVVTMLGEVFDGSKGDLEEARRLTAQLQYWKRIEEKIVDKLSTVK